MEEDDRSETVPLAVSKFGLTQVMLTCRNVVPLPPGAASAKRFLGVSAPEGIGFFFIGERPQRRDVSGNSFDEETSRFEITICDIKSWIFVICRKPLPRGRGSVKPAVEFGVRDGIGFSSPAKGRRGRVGHIL